MRPEIKEIRHFHLFCGLGGGAHGFNRGESRVGNMAARFRCIGGVDVDAAAIADFSRLAGVHGTVLDMFDLDQYRAFHGAEPPAGWRECGPADIRRAAGNERPHIVFLSAPCLPADGLVLTERGPRAISTIRSGDLVLTHKGRMREVTHVGTHRYTGTMHGLRLNGTVDTQWFTDEHPMWVRRVVRNKTTDRRRQLGDAAFVPAKDVRVGDRIGFPVEPEQQGVAANFVQRLGNPQAVAKGGHGQGRYAKSEHVAIVDRVRDLSASAADPGLWFLIGCYLGDGYRGTGERYEVAYCVGAADGALARRVKNAVSELGLPYYEDQAGGPTNIKLRVRSRHLHMICGAFGDGADTKFIPPELMGLESELLRALIDGYRSTDGSEQDARTMERGNTLQARWKIPSVSLQLLRDVQRLLLRLGTFSSIHKCWAGGPQTIMGREVQTKPRWELNVRMDPQKRTCFEFIDGAVWVRVREAVRRDADEPVWNLSVADDDTFCAPMMATHNCKGFSGLLAEGKSKTDKYQALNRLTVRGVWLMLEAWADDPPELIVFENVPRIATRGRHLLDQIGDLLRAYGYAVAETTHDCGELGGLAQSRKRFLLVARHKEKVPPFLYEPPKRPLASVGTVLGRMPLPGDAAGGPMHRMPSLQWKTWVRLAFVEAGSDWRSLNRLKVVDGHLADYLVVPEYHAGYLGVNHWGDPAGTVQGHSGPTNGSFSVADPRFNGHQFQQYGVRNWDEPTGAVSGQAAVGGGAYAVADPRHAGPAKHSNEFRIVAWDRAAQAVTSAHGSGQAVADPRPGLRRGKGDHYLTGGHYGVVPWSDHCGAVSSSAGHDSGRWSVADPRTDHFSRVGKMVMPSPADKLVAVIRALDGTWHRPFTTLELAALQSLVDPEEQLELDGLSDQSWRERIGNAVPPAAAQAIASEMGRTLLLAWSGETFCLASTPIWVRQVAVSLSVSAP